MRTPISLPVVTALDELRKLRGYKPTRFKAPGSVYKEGFADAAVFFINNLRHTKGKWYGEPFELIDWQERLIRDVFGIVRKSDECRQFKTVYVEVPKKQGKSELAAAIALLLTCLDNERGGEVYGCANDRNQAGIVFDVAVEMVNQFPQLKRHMILSTWKKRLTYKPLDSFYQVLTADASTKHGINAHGVLFDELHALSDRKFFDVMMHGSGYSREQPLNFIITTAGVDRNSVCFEMHQKAADILENRIVDHKFYPVIYGAADDDDWTDPEVWKKANPSLGVTYPFEVIRDAYEDAKLNPVNENLFRQYNLNQWVKQTVRWMDMAKWDQCAFKFDLKALKGRMCYGGLDLSATNDITAFVLVFPPEYDDDKYICVPFFWLPEETLETRVKRDHVKYDVWKAQGLLKTTEGDVIRYSFIKKAIEDLGKQYKILSIGVDQWGAWQMIQELEDADFKINRIAQGYYMSPSTKQLMQLVLEQRLTHGGNEPLRWMADNLVVEMDAIGNIRPSKKKATEKIDGMIALIMALDLAVRNEDKPRKSVYDTRGIIGYGADGWFGM